MATVSARPAKQLNTMDRYECVLLIETDADAAAKILDDLTSAPEERFDVEWVTDLSGGIGRLRSGAVGAVLLDLAPPDSHGLENFDKLHQAAPHVPILILADTGAEGTAKQAVQRGAQDYLLWNHADAYGLTRAVRSMMDRRAARALSLENDIANTTLDSIGRGILRTDKFGAVTYLNRIAGRMAGWSQAEALGHPVSDVLHIIDAANGETIPNIAELIHRGETEASTTHCANCVLVRRDGFHHGIENLVTVIHGRDGGVTGAVFAFHDVSAARATSLDISHKAEHDFLTDLPNRMLFNDRLAQAISLAERQTRRLAIMFVDLDHFKKINDSLGHDVGDKLLQSVAGRLVASVRRTDTVSRMGGDEFVVLLSQVERGEDAAFSARKILRSLTAPHIIDNKSLDINVSIGVSTYPADGTDAESLMNKADIAMYEAKQGGRNNYQFFRSDMQERLTERQSLEGDLRYALGKNEFVLHFQPKFNLYTGEITGMEALIRWAHPERGMVYPLQFIPIAEECGLILTIGRWVLLEACRQARAWTDSGLGNVPIAVNVSAAEFGAKDFLSGVRAALIATGVEPPNLELELTESVLMQDAEATVGTLGALRAMGVKLAIDDFGTGYSSFSYLRRFPVDVLKIHQSFVHEITENPGDATIVAAMINIGKSLNQSVIAEGVETRAQLNFLQRHGCNEGQGYYFSRPLGAEQASKILDARTQEAVAQNIS